MKVRRAMKKLGGDINIARRKRRLTVEMMAERIGASKSTYLRVERGESTVSMGVYAMCLFSLGLDGIDKIADVSKDTAGLLLEEERLPTRVRLGGKRGKAGGEK